MGKLFASLYLIIALSLVLITALLDQLLFSGPQELAIERQVVSELIQQSGFSENVEAMLNKHNIGYQYIAWNTVNWSDSELASLRAGQPVSLFNNIEWLLYLPLEDQQLVVISWPEEQPNTLRLTLYALLFFSLLAAVIALWLWPQWRDIKKLREAAVSLQPDGSLPSVQLSKTSAMSPISDALAQLSDKVRQLIRSQRELTGAVAHELRTPLARLKFATAMLPQNQQAVRLEMEQDIQDIDRLVQEMLDYTSMDVHEPELNIGEVPLKTLCHQLVSRLQETIRHSIKVSGSELTITGDGYFIERAVMNLMVNADRHANSEITISVVEADSEYRIMIEDDGPGVPIHMRDKIFQPFYRPDKSRNRQSGGAGLGLAIVSRIMHWHGGTCSVVTSSLGGACFTLHFKH